MGATDNASNMEGMSAKKKKRDSSPQISSIVSMLWPQFDNANTGVLDKIEALNFTNEVLIMKGKRKM